MAHYRRFNREFITTALGTAFNFCKWTVGATGAVGDLYQAKSQSIRSITREQEGEYTVQFNAPFPGAVQFVSCEVHPDTVGAPAVELKYVPGSYDNTLGTLTLRSSVELTDGVAATGTITCVAKANFDDNDTVTISDGDVSSIYEFDFAGDGVTAGRVQVNISAATTAESVALILKAAIEATTDKFTVTTNGAGVITLTQNRVGTAGNVTITEAVTDAGFAVTGMASGVNPTGAAVELDQNSEVHMMLVELRSENFDVASD
jgi:hypothetical protein